MKLTIQEKKALAMKGALLVLGIKLIIVSYLVPRAAWSGGAMGGTLTGETNELSLVGFGLCGLVIFWIGIGVWRNQK